MKKKILISVLIASVIWLFLDFSISHLLKHGLDLNYGLTQHSDIIILGHSHVMMGVDRKTLGDSLGLKVSKYTRSGVDMTERRLMNSQFLSSKYSDSLKIAVVGVDIYSFQGSGLSENSYTLFYPFFEDKNIDAYLKDNCSFSEYWQHKLIRLSRYSDDLINSSIRGWLGDDRNLKNTSFDANVSEDILDKWRRSIGFNKDLISQLDTIISQLRYRDVDVILLNTPTMRIVNQFQPERYDSIISYFHSLANKDDQVHFLDLNPIYQDSVQLFFDPVHVNNNGRKRVTSKLIEYIKDLDCE